MRAVDAGASVTARTKAATLETGLVIQVPEYGAGRAGRVDTRTGDFIQRGAVGGQETGGKGGQGDRSGELESRAQSRL